MSVVDVGGGGGRLAERSYAAWCCASGSAPMWEGMAWGWFLGKGTRLYSRLPVHSGVG